MEKYDDCKWCDNVTPEELEKYPDAICYECGRHGKNVVKSTPKWPTLEGRLNQPLASRKEALLQFYETYKMGHISMSEKALEEVEKYLKEDEKLQAAAKKVKAAVDASPDKVTFEETKKQVENCHG